MDRAELITEIREFIDNYLVITKPCRPRSLFEKTDDSSYSSMSVEFEDFEEDEIEECSDKNVVFDEKLEDSSYSEEDEFSEYESSEDESWRFESDEKEYMPDCRDDDYDYSDSGDYRPAASHSIQIPDHRKLEDLMSQLEESFSQRLLRFIKEKGLNETETYKKAYIDRRHFSKIKNEVNYTPNKKTVFAFSIAMELSEDETKDLLKSAGFALSMSSEYDVIMLYFLRNRIYDMFEINDVLYEFDQPVFE